MASPSINEDYALLKRLLTDQSAAIHMIGICGIGMAGLAVLLSSRGFRVSGCDAAPNELAQWLEKNGITVEKGHAPRHLEKNTDWVVRTNAAGPENEEVAHALRLGLPLFRRGAVLAELCRGSELVAVCGTHGKTTTTAMLAHIFRTIGRDISFLVGGRVPCLGDAPAAHGSDPLMLVEADESDGTLALYTPKTAVLTSADFDHAEHFSSPAEFAACFAALLNNVKGDIVFCAEDKGAAALCAGRKTAKSYGLDAEGSVFSAKVKKELPWKTELEIFKCGAALGRLEIPAHGRHNALNALAASAVALEKSVPFPEIGRALASFSPVRRRFERLVERDGALVISDYAHHPAEIAAGVKAALMLGHRRKIGVFQPHRHSRTCALAAEFAQAFAGLDMLILCPVYPAWEAPIEGGNTWDLYAALRAAGKTKTLYASSLEQTLNYLKAELRAGDVLCIFGAGDVEKIAAALSAEIAARGLQRLNPAHAWVDVFMQAGLRPIRGAPLAGCTTFRTGGAADILLDIENAAEAAAARDCSKKAAVPAALLGRGANTLISDLGVRGAVVRLNGPEFNQITESERNVVVAGAAVRLPSLLGWAIKRSKGGLNFLAGIPGTVGGAVHMNAGAGGGEIADALAWVKCLDAEGMERVISRANLDFRYRACPTLEGMWVLEAAFNVEDAPQEALRNDVAGRMRRRAWLSRLRCAGSFFKNPKGDSAGRLIEAAGLKGFSIGGAHVCKEHANVIVASDSAVSSDIQALADKIVFDVRRRFGVALEPEVVLME